MIKANGCMLPEICSLDFNLLDPAPLKDCTPCDCACTINTIRKSTSFNSSLLGKDTILMQNPDSYLDQVNGWTVGLSGTGNQLLVLNDISTKFLNNAITPSTIMELSRSVGIENCTEPSIISTVQSLIQGELLIPYPQSDLPFDFVGKSVKDSRISAWFHLTDKCNMDCSYCFVPKKSNRMNAEVARNAVEAVFNSAITAGARVVNIKYAGGEPSLNFSALRTSQQHAEALSSRTNIELQAEILTNAVNLSSRLINYLCWHHIMPVVSLDGVGLHHDRQRPLIGGRNSYQMVIGSIEKLMNAGLLPHISITITSQNVNDLPLLTEELLARGLRFSYNFYRPPAYKHNFIALMPSPDQLLTSLVSCYQLISDHSPQYSLLHYIVDRINLTSCSSFPCGLGINYVVIGSEGSVYKCQMEMDKPITYISHPDILCQIQTDCNGLQNVRVEDKECAHCIWRYRCGGGCPHMAILENKPKNQRSTYCSVYRGILPEIFKLEAWRLINQEILPKRTKAL